MGLNNRKGWRKLLTHNHRQLTHMPTVVLNQKPFTAERHRIMTKRNAILPPLPLHFTSWLCYPIGQTSFLFQRSIPPYTELDMKKNFLSPSGLVTVAFTSPEIFLLAQKLMTINNIASVDNMKRIQCGLLNCVVLSSRYAKPKDGFILL